MPFAAVVEVNLEDRDTGSSVKLLEEGMIPLLKSLPGFQSARFVRSLDGGRGVATVIFGTEGDAKAALEAMETKRPPGSPPIEATGLSEMMIET